MVAAEVHAVDIAVVFAEFSPDVKGTGVREINHIQPPHLVTVCTGMVVHDAVVDGHLVGGA